MAPRKPITKYDSRNAMIGITMFFSTATVNTAGIFDLSCSGFVPCKDMPNAIRIIGTAELPIMLIGS